MRGFRTPEFGATCENGGMSAVASLLDRVTVDPNVCHGKPIIRGMRWPVASLLELMASGMSSDEILADHPELEPDDLRAVLEFAAMQASGYYVVPIAQ